MEKIKFDRKIVEQSIFNRNIEMEGQVEKLRFPLSSEKFCQVCLATIECRRNHIRDYTHLQYIYSSKANNYIKQLCSMLKRGRNKKERNGKMGRGRKLANWNGDKTKKRGKRK